MKERLKGSEKRKAIIKDWAKTALEIIRWAFVIWLLLPIRQASSGPVNFTRVAVGILLFIIFAGKLFYDTVIMGILHRRRTSMKQDILTLIGMVLVLSLVVGLLLLFAGFLLVELFKMSQSNNA